MRKIIVRNTTCTNKFEIYKNVIFAKIYIEFLTFNIRKNNSKKRELKK